MPLSTDNQGYAHRLAEIEPFKVMKLLARANALQAAGHDVVHMEVGEPDFETPATIVDAGREALAGGKTKYTPAEGTPALRDAISNFYATDFGVDVDPQRIFVTAGASGALLLTSALLLDPGEGLLMADPGYPCNRHFLKTFSGEGQLVPVTPDDGYQLTSNLVESAWLETTRGVLLASPANPTGALVPVGELAKISDLIAARSSYLVVDEIYQGLCYEEASRTVLSLSTNAFVINSFSKYFGMTGWRLGWLVAPPDAVADLTKLAQNLFICASSISQEAALAAFAPSSRETMEANKREFMKRRDFLVPALREIGFGVPRMPDGAFYIYARLPDGMGPSEVFCERLLEDYHVAVTPGTDFGFYLADDHVRFSYAQPIERLERGVERIARALEAWG